MTTALWRYERPFLVFQKRISETALFQYSEWCQIGHLMYFVLKNDPFLTSSLSLIVFDRLNLPEIVTI